MATKKKPAAQRPVSQAQADRIIQRERERASRIQRSVTQYSQDRRQAVTRLADILATEFGIDTKKKNCTESRATRGAERLVSVIEKCIRDYDEYRTENKRIRGFYDDAD